MVHFCAMNLKKDTSMKQVKKVQAVALAAFTITAITAQAQDQDVIVTMKGQTINAHVRKVKDGNAIYWKFFHRVKFPVDKILYIQYADGKKTEFNKVTSAKNYKNYSQLAKSSPVPAKKDSVAGKTTAVAPAPGYHKFYIERLGNNFRLDSTDIVGPRRIEQVLAQSGDPMMAANLKVAKTLRKFSSITKIASYPGSTGGSYASYLTFKNLFDQMKAGPVSFNTYLGAGLSFIGTLSLPITQAILKHKQNKMYDKMLTMYSQGN